MAQLVKITLHPDDDSPVYGFAQYQSDDRDDEHDGRFTMRTDPERLLGAKQHLDQGATVHLAGGSWNQRPGWPEDWEDGTADDDAQWSGEQTWEWVDDGWPKPGTA